MINLTTDRRYCHTQKFKCRLIKRNELGKNDNESISYDKRGTMFFASEINEKALGENQIEDAFAVQYETKAIQTTDIINVEERDRVWCDGALWIVDRVTSRRIRSTSQYLENRRTIIGLRK